MTPNGTYEIVSKKRNGLELDRPDIAHVVSGCVSGEIPDYQLAALLMAIYLRGMSERELADLTELMLASGDRILLDRVPGAKIDKHSFHAKVGDRVEKGRPLVSVYSDRPEETPGVLERLGQALRIGERPAPAAKLVRYVVDKDGSRPWPD